MKRFDCTASRLVVSKSVSQLFPIILLGVIVCGCTTPRTYSQGAGTDKSGLITITCDSETNHKLIPGANRTLTITKLDGKNLGSFTSTYIVNGVAARAPGVEVAQVTPGRHEVVLHWNHKGTYANSSLWFDAEPGKSYVAKWKENGDATFWKAGTTQIWIEEAGTGKRVGGKAE